METTALEVEHSHAPTGVTVGFPLTRTTWQYSNRDSDWHRSSLYPEEITLYYIDSLEVLNCTMTRASCSGRNLGDARESQTRKIPRQHRSNVPRCDDQPRFRENLEPVGTCQHYPISLSYLTWLGGLSCVYSPIRQGGKTNGLERQLLTLPVLRPTNASDHVSA
jgi:hypothetical protein